MELKMKMTVPVEYSVVLPLYNERENLEPLLVELEGALSALRRPFEVVCVDDASEDGGMDLLRSLQFSRPWLRTIRHRQRSGQSAAFLTGFGLARGEVILTMDSDMQHDPADIPALLSALNGDVAAVCGVRAQRHDNWRRRISSAIANRFARWITGDEVRDAGCTFRVLRRSALVELPAFNGLHRFLPTILRFQGLKVVHLQINHRSRYKGIAKYGIGNRLWRGILDCLAMRWYRARCLQAKRALPEECAREQTPQSLGGITPGSPQSGPGVSV
jgi:glycosyltransferase involved in cell wall biosynthesis